MLVVVGIPAWQPAADDPAKGRAAGPAVEVARGAVAAGARVELVGKVGDDPVADRLLLDLARAGIGHVAVLRDPGLPTRVLPPAPPRDADATADEDDAIRLALEVDTPEVAGSDGRSRWPPAGSPDLVLEAADLELALRYLIDFRVLVVADDLAAPAVRVVGDAAAFAGATLVAVAAAGSAPTLPEDATVLERPDEDPEAEFARLVGSYAAALDHGEAPEEAFQRVTAERGWEPTG